MDQKTYLITFDEVSVAEANQYAEELRGFLLDASPDIVVRRRRDDPRTQDFGATLVLLLGTPATAAVVTAIKNWLIYRNPASITIKRDNEEIVVEQISSKKAEELVELFLKNH